MDTGQYTKNPHIIAARIISSGKTITAKDVNKVLKSQGYHVTQEELDSLTNLPSSVHVLTTLRAIQAVFLPDMNMWAIYMFFNDSYPLPYVGSTINIPVQGP